VKRGVERRKQSLTTGGGRSETPFLQKKKKKKLKWIRRERQPPFRSCYGCLSLETSDQNLNKKDAPEGSLFP